MAVVGFVAGAATVADEIKDVEALGEDEDDERENEYEIQQCIDFFAADGDIWRRPIEVRCALLGLGREAAAGEKKCGEEKDTQQEIHSRVKSGGGRCGGCRGSGSGGGSGASCRNRLCRNGFQLFLSPRILTVGVGSADFLHIVGCDRRCTISPLGADVGEDRSDMLVLEVRPRGHGIIVGGPLHLHRSLNADKKDFDKVVIPYPVTANDPFAGNKGRKLPGDAHA